MEGVVTDHYIYLINLIDRSSGLSLEILDITQEATSLPLIEPSPSPASNSAVTSVGYIHSTVIYTTHILSQYVFAFITHTHHTVKLAKFS
jgi:hypothetical protein